MLIIVCLPLRNLLHLVHNVLSELDSDSISSSNGVCMHVCVCHLFVHRLATETFSSLRNQAVFWVSVVPPTMVFVWHWICIHTRIHVCADTHRLRGTPDSLKNEAVFSHLGTRLL